MLSIKDSIRDLSTIIPADSPAAYAYGCAHCKHGLIDPPPANNYSVPLYVVRVLQALNHQLVFCECLAGTMYRGRLLNAHAKLKQDECYGTLFKKFVDESDTAPSMRIA